ncbi:MAG: hypothetical protein JWM37_585 [Candidatus Saccharibacteria bacterium]|nr:hypothetical protein [Candidatus Saccharibacteria bacterium]
MQIIILTLIAYLSGSLPAGKIIARMHGIDIQRRGSGNIGFANVQRVLGWRAGLITLIIDTAKGFGPTWLAAQVVGADTAFWIGLAAIAGHLWPIWLNLKGGKGVATGLGIMLYLQPLAAMVGLAIYCFWRWRGWRSSSGSLSGILGLALITIWMEPSAWWQPAILGLIACWTLRHNIRGKVHDYDTETIPA